MRTIEARHATRMTRKDKLAEIVATLPDAVRDWQRMGSASRGGRPVKRIVYGEPEGLGCAAGVLAEEDAGDLPDAIASQEQCE